MSSYGSNVEMNCCGTRTEEVRGLTYDEFSTVSALYQIRVGRVRCWSLNSLERRKMCLFDEMKRAQVSKYVRDARNEKREGTTVGCEGSRPD